MTRDLLQKSGSDHSHNVPPVTSPDHETKTSSEVARDDSDIIEYFEAATASGDVALVS